MGHTHERNEMFVWSSTRDSVPHNKPIHAAELFQCSHAQLNIVLHAYQCQTVWLNCSQSVSQSAYAREFRCSWSSSKSKDVCIMQKRIRELITNWGEKMFFFSIFVFPSFVPRSHHLSLTLYDFITRLYATFFPIIRKNIAFSSI